MNNEAKMPIERQEAEEEAALRRIVNDYGELNGEALMAENARLEATGEVQIPAELSARLEKTYRRVLSMESVSYQYRGASGFAVKDASSEFETGRLYAVIGPSGSGKSTLLSMLAGLDLPTQGEVNLTDKGSLAGLDLDQYRRESVAMIFQAFHLLPLLTVLENVCYPMELCGVKTKDAKQRAKILLERVGIAAEKQKRFPSHLSGGEQQRVAIARALSTGAPILLADEPTGNLDGENTRLVLDILQSLAHDEGRCVIVVTHDPEVAEKADVVLKMKDGALTRAQ